jgi:putative flippase GtrA
MVLGRLTRYFFVGGVSATLDTLIFFIFAKLLGFDYLVVASFGFMIATLVNYCLSVRLVFRSGVRFSRTQEFFLVYLASAISLLVNLMVLYIMVSMMQLELIFSKLTATASVFIWNFVVRNFFIFREPKAKKSGET